MPPGARPPRRPARIRSPARRTVSPAEACRSAHRSPTATCMIIYSRTDRSGGPEGA